MKDILKALERKEKVVIMYHGKQRGIIIPASETKAKQAQVSEHPFFGMFSHDAVVSEVLTQLRGGRYCAV